MQEATTTDLATWLKGLGFDDLGGGWLVKAEARCRIIIKGSQVNIYVQGAMPWSARLEDPPKRVVTAILRAAGAISSGEVIGGA